jgi:hypothetical protein
MGAGSITSANFLLSARSAHKSPDKFFCRSSVIRYICPVLLAYLHPFSLVPHWFNPGNRVSMMTFINRLRAFFSQYPPVPVPEPTTVGEGKGIPAPFQQAGSVEVVAAPLLPSPAIAPLPAWLADEESLRDEGVLFGLSNARPDIKIAQISGFFASQAIPLTELATHYAGQIRALTTRIDQRENQLTSLRDQLAQLRDSQPVSTTLVRHFVSLGISIVLCIGTFYLVDDTLYRPFPNHWVSMGVFLAGLFNLFGRISFFYETTTRLTGQRFMEEIGLPLAAAVFVLVHALSYQPVSQAIGLFIFILFVFLLSGKLLLSTLSSLQHELGNVQKNRQLMTSKRIVLPLLESQISQLEQDIDRLNGQNLPVVTALDQIESELTQLNTQRDKLVNLFLGEFELARSLRDRLTKQQRQLIMND